MLLTYHQRMLSMPSLRTDKPLITRTQHICCWCGEPLTPKSTAVKVTWTTQGLHTRRYFHPECHEAEHKLGQEDSVTLDEWYEELCTWYMVRGETTVKE
jgi:hypothetical protein